MTKRRYLALCLSTKDETSSWALSDIPFYCFHETTHFPREKSRERIDYLADKWNRCHELGVKHFPETTHILNIGSYYLHQRDSIMRLVRRYEEIDDEIILSGNVWTTESRKLVVPYHETYDTWGCPDLQQFSYHFRKPKDVIQCDSGLAMPCIYPLKAWKEHPFHNPETTNDGIWYNQFARESGIPAIADLSIAFYRTWRDSGILHRTLKWHIHHQAIVMKQRIQSLINR